MKLTVRNLYFPLPRAYLEFLLSQASYRAAMCITEVMVFKSTWMEKPATTYVQDAILLWNVNLCLFVIDADNTWIGRITKKQPSFTQALRNDRYILTVEKFVSPPLFLYSLLLTLTV